MFWRLNQTYFAAALTTTFMLLVPAQSANAQTQELSPAFEQPNIANTLRDYLSGRPLAEKLRIRRTDELLRPPFASKPTDSVKGLAAKIRAEELDVCNRVKAAEYLGTVDCKAYPEAQEMLIDTLHNDKYELVRLAAARALGVMLSCRPQEAKIMMCDPNYQPTADCPMKPHGRYQAPWEKSNKRFVSGLDACPGCCNADVLNALAKTAYESNEDGCCFEPSARVRQMAAWAMSQCGVCCREQAEQIIHEKKTEDKEEEKKGEVDPNKSKEVDPTRADENDGKEGSSNGESTSTPRPFLFPPAAAMVPPSPAGTATPLAALKHYCVVSLHAQKFVPANPSFSSVFEGRLYYFASEEAKAAFDAQPQRYSVAHSGSDPIVLQETGESVEGKYLRMSNGRLYLFTSEENWLTYVERVESRVSQTAAFVPPLPE